MTISRNLGKQLTIIIVLFTLVLSNDSLKQILKKYNDQNDVLELTTTTLDDSLKDFKYIVIQTYAYWSNESVAFYPEYQKVGKILRNSDPMVMVSRVDAAANGVPDRIRLSRGKFPVIVLVINNQTIHEYIGALEANSIVKWAQKLSGSQLSKEIFQNDNIDQLVKENQEIVVYFGDNEKDKQFEQFKQASMKNLDIQFAHSFSSSFREQNKAKPHSIVVFKSYDEKRNDMEGPIDASSITAFTQKYAYPNLMHYDGKAYSRIIAQKNSALFLIADSTEKSQHLQSLIQELATSLKGRVLFTYLRQDNSRYNETMRIFGLKEEDLPAFRILGFQGDQSKYKPEFTEITKQTLTKFITNFRIRRLVPYYNSEVAPLDNSKRQIKIVVANTFDQFVLQSPEDIFIVFYNPDCTKCDELLKQLEKLAKKISSNKNIIIAQCDISKNEIPSAMFRDTPKIKFYKNGNKHKSEDIPNDKTNKEYLNLLKEKTSYPWVLDGKVDL